MYETNLQEGGPDAYKEPEPQAEVEEEEDADDKDQQPKNVEEQAEGVIQDKLAARFVTTTR